MESYSTYIFKPEKERSRDSRRYSLFIFVAVAVIVAVAFSTFFYGLPFLGFFITISSATALVKMKLEDDKKAGITAYGKRGAKFIITETHFEMGDALMPFEELTDLVIYVDEYAGQQKLLFGVHHGGNNEITFRYRGEAYSVNYIIKDRADFYKVEKLVEKIERKS